jgi:hypothetical protein
VFGKVTVAVNEAVGVPDPMEIELLVTTDNPLAVADSV